MSQRAPWVRFTERTEGAFTLVLPADWSAQSGVVRGAMDPRPWYRVLSPGGTAEVRGSDPRVPKAFVASPYGFPMMPMPGIVPRPYVPPEVFAEEYARAFAHELGAQAFVRTGVRDVEAMLAGDARPTTRPRTQTLLAQGAAMAGVSFACPDRGISGIVDVCTLRVDSPMGLVWMPIVTALRGPTEAWPHAQVTLRGIAQSYETSPAWQQGVVTTQRQQHHDAMAAIETGNQILRMQAQSGMEAIHAHAQRAHMAAQTAAEVDALRDQGWRAQQAANDERQRRAVNAVREAVDLYDPSTGEVFRGAPAGYASWWTDGASVVVGSHGDENPDAARLRPLEDLDHRPPHDRR